MKEIEENLDPTLATSLEVYTFDVENVQPLDFRVERLDNGRWVIPSHHNYPADAEDHNYEADGRSSDKNTFSA